MGYIPIVNRALRLEEFMRRMQLAQPAASAPQALDLLSSTLKQVEDELSGIPPQPDQWQNDSRMYPPQPDHARDVEGRLDLTRYRSRGHNTWIGANGAILIQTVHDEKIELDKQGADGCTIELD